MGSFYVITEKNVGVSEILYSDQFEFDTGAIILAGNGDFNVKWYRGKFDA